MRALREMRALRDRPNRPIDRRFGLPAATPQLSLARSIACPQHIVPARPPTAVAIAGLARDRRVAPAPGLDPGLEPTPAERRTRARALPFRRSFAFLRHD